MEQKSKLANKKSSSKCVNHKNYHQWKMTTFTDSNVLSVTLSWTKFNEACQSQCQCRFIISLHYYVTRYSCLNIPGIYEVCDYLARSLHIPGVRFHQRFHQWFRSLICVQRCGHGIDMKNEIALTAHFVFPPWGEALG